MQHVLLSLLVVARIVDTGAPPSPPPRQCDIYADIVFAYDYRIYMTTKHAELSVDHHLCLVGGVSCLQHAKQLADDICAGVSDGGNLTQVEERASHAMPMSAMPTPITYSGTTVTAPTSTSFRACSDYIANDFPSIVPQSVATLNTACDLLKVAAHDLMHSPSARENARKFIIYFTSGMSRMTCAAPTPTFTTTYSESANEIAACREGVSRQRYQPLAHG